MSHFHGRPKPQEIQSAADLAKVIESRRKEQDLTQLDLAGLASTGNRFIIDLEKGKATCQIQKILDVLKTLGIKLLVE